MQRLTALFLTLLLALTTLPALAEDADALMNFVQQALDSSGDLLYEKDEEYLCFSLVFEAEDPRLGDIFVFVDVDPYGRGVIVSASYERPIPQEAVDETIRFINLINSDLLDGKYYIVPENGDLYYERFFDAEILDSARDERSAREMLLHMIYDAPSDADYDVDYFMELIGGEKAANVFAMYLADD